jgi:hypothetical protein
VNPAIEVALIGEKPATPEAPSRTSLVLMAWKWLHALFGRLAKERLKYKP